MKQLLLFSVLIFVATSCSSVKDQGIQGTIRWVSGNQMPGPDQNRSTQSKGISREIYIFPALHIQNHKLVDGFYKEIGIEPVAVVKSSANGSFKVALAPGIYSILSKEEKGFFANQYDGDGCVNCVEVKPKAYAELNFKIDYEAAY